MSSSVLVVFCKWPRLNQGKQRFVNAIGRLNTLELASLLLDCTIEDMSRWGGETVMAISDIKDLEVVEKRLRDRAINAEKTSVIVQQQGNLGERINSVDRMLRKKGKENLIFIGTDSPILNDQYFQEARESLTYSDIVISDASDGGVILMGSQKPWPNLYSLPWSTNKLSKELIALCENSGLNVDKITSGFDVDNEDDLKKLLHSVKNDTRISRIKLYQWLSKRQN